jgi:hypothetical protein
VLVALIDRDCVNVVGDEEVCKIGQTLFVSFQSFVNQVNISVLVVTFLIIIEFTCIFEGLVLVRVKVIVHQTFLVVQTSTIAVVSQSEKFARVGCK